MEHTQAFRPLGTATETEIIGAELVDGHMVVFWEDIERVFPGIKLVKNGGVVVNLLRDASGTR